MRAASTVLGFAAAFAVALPAVAAGQGDYRHLDEGRPTRVEDAYALKFLEWEWQLGTGAFAEENAAVEGEAVFEAKLGIGGGLQAGVEGHGAWARRSGETTTGLETVNLHLLYNLNQEGRRAPALALRGDWRLPGAGDLARTDAGGRLRVLATRTLGATRLHANAARAWARDPDGGHHWEAGLGVDRALGLSGRAVVGDIYAEIPDRGGPTRWWADAGIRLQISKQSVLDVGATVRIDEWIDGTANAGLILGISRTFGFNRLVNVPSYPDPTLR